MPQEQEGDITVFQRRSPDMSLLPTHQSLEILYNHIRMLDAETYPAAYIEYGNYLLEFCNAKLETGEINCEVKIKLIEP